MAVNFDPKNLDVTVRQGARLQESRYYEMHRAAGVQLRSRYRPEGQFSKGRPANVDHSDSGPRRRAGKVSWKKGTGLGDKAAGGKR